MNFVLNIMFFSFFLFSQDAVTSTNSSFCKKHGKNVYFGPSYSENKPKKNVLIGWDLNNVIFTNKIGALQFMKAAFERHGIVDGAVGIQNFLSLKKRMNKERKKRGLSLLKPEHMIYHLLRSYNPEKQACAQFLQSSIEGPDNVDMNVARIVYDCDQSGYKQAVLSNMFESNLMIQIDMVHEKLVEASNQFRFNNNVNQNCDNPKSAFLRILLSMLANMVTRVIPLEENNWTHKPEKQMYQLFLSLNKESEDTITIFIDDNRSNIEAAVAHGFDIGIVYTNAKNLRQILKHLGFIGVKQEIANVGIA